MGTKAEIPYKITNEDYGDFSCPENKYKKISLNEKIFDDFFKTFIRNDGSEKTKIEENSEKLKNLEIHKKQEISQIFLQLPNSQTKIIQNNPEKNLNGNNSYGFKQSNMGNIDCYVPYYKEKENTYWTVQMEKNSNSHLSNDQINSYINPTKINELKNLKTSSKLFEIITPKVNSKFGHFDEYKNEAFEKTNLLSTASVFLNVKKNFINYF